MVRRHVESSSTASAAMMDASKSPWTTFCATPESGSAHNLYTHMKRKGKCFKNKEIRARTCQFPTIESREVDSGGLGQKSAL